MTIPADARQLTPGFYATGDGALHIDLDPDSGGGARLMSPRVCLLGMA